MKSDKVTVLIGTNHADLLVHREYRTGKDGEPVPVKTALGWLIVGVTKSNKLNMNYNVSKSNDINVLNENIKRFWWIDSYRINPKSQLLTPDENRGLTILENTTTFKNGNFETGLLCKDDHPILLNNCDMAVKRFKVLENQFRKNLE